MGIWEIDLRSGQLTGSVLYRESLDGDRAKRFSWEDLERAIHPDDRTRWKAALSDALATGREFDIKYRILRTAGETVWLHVRAQVARATDGVPLRMVGISLDITERHVAEPAVLNASESRSRPGR